MIENIVYIYFQKMNTYLVIGLLLLCWAESQEAQAIQLGKIQSVELKAKENKEFSVTISEETDMNMFIVAESPYNDPFELPSMAITSTNNYTQYCYQESSDYSDICLVESDELLKDRTFIIQLYCVVDCKFEFTAYLNSVVEVRLGKKVDMRAFDDLGLAQGLSIHIPEDENFTQIYLIANIENQDQVNEGLDMYANFGEEVEMPSPTNYQKKGESAWGDSIGIFISSQDIKQGDQIKVYIFLGQGMKVKFSSQSIFGNHYKIFLNSPFLDFTTYEEQRIYMLDLTAHNQSELADYDIQVTFIIYSGNPTIDVAFSEQWESTRFLDNQFIDSTLTYFITPDTRQEFGFAGYIYIRVSSYWSSSYYVNTGASRKTFVDVIEQVNQIVRITGGNIKNFLYEDINTDNGEQEQIIHYKTTVEVMEGSAVFGIRRCYSLENDLTLECLFEDLSFLNSSEVMDSFHEIKLEKKVFYNTYYFFWTVDVKECPTFTNRNNQLQHICEFQTILFSHSPTQDLYASVLVEKRTINTHLREGSIIRDSLLKDEYRYYSFMLNDTSQITSMQIYVTVIKGDVALVMSQTEQFPTLTDYNNTIVSVYDSIILNKEEISKGTYYVSVYGYDVSEYTISIAMQRESGEEKEQTETELKSGITQKYTMKKGKEELDFILKSSTEQTANIVLTELTNHITYSIYAKDAPHQSIECGNENKCTFVAVPNTIYKMEVHGQKSKVQVFTITLTYSQSCIVYPINFPLFVSLDADNRQCYVYSVPEEGGIQISLSLSAIELVDKKVEIELVFPQKKIQLDSHEKVINEDMLELLCQSEDSEDHFQVEKMCEFQVQMWSQEKVVVEVAVQTNNGENVLFDGVAQKVTSQLSPSHSKNFYYYLFDDESLTLFLTTQTSSKYVMKAKIVSSNEFLKPNSSQLYPNYEEETSLTTKTTSSSSVAVLYIDKKTIEKAPCDLCVVVISVFGHVQGQTYIFQIEATQNTRKLNFGDSKIGYIEKQEMKQYEIEVERQNPALLTVRQFNEEVCFTSYVQAGDDELVEFFQFTEFSAQNQKYDKIVLIGKSDKCTYQISYNSLEFPIIEMLSLIPYQVELENSRSKFFLYYHNSKESFRVIEMMEQGDANIAAFPVTLGTRVEDLINRNIQDFPFVEKEFGDLKIDANSSDFCINCYYFIAVKGQPLVHEELLVIPASSPIPLKVGSTMKDSIANQEVKTYVFYSLTSFNLSVSILYGQVNVFITNPAGIIVKNQTLNMSEEFRLSAGNRNTDESVDYFDEKSKFTITIEGVEESGFYLKANKAEKVLRIVEGLPVSLKLLPNQEQKVTFRNSIIEGQLTILVENTDYHEGDNTSLSFNAQVSGKDVSIISGVNKSEGSYNVELTAVKGLYTFSIKSEKEVSVSVILAKKSLTFLKQGKTNLMKTGGTFEIYNPGKNIIVEVYGCEGSVWIEASNSYASLMDPNSNNKTIMEHSNEGGHYVVSASNISGLYFLKTYDPREKPQKLSYLITYYSYSSSQMPYKTYKLANPEIKYKNHEESVEFVLTPVQSKPKHPSLKSITYKLYFSSNHHEINRMLSCSLGNLSTHMETVTDVKDMKKNITFSIQKDQIIGLVGKEGSYVVGAEAVADLPNVQKGEIPQLIFAYDNTYVSVSSEPVYQPSDNLRFVLLFIVLPFLVGCFLLYMAGRYCLKNFSAYPTQLIEEEPDVGASEQQFKHSVEKGPAQQSLA